MTYLRTLVVEHGSHTYSQQRMCEDFITRVAGLPGADAVVDKIKAVYESSEVDERHLEISIPELDARRARSDWHPIARDAILSLAGRTLRAALTGAQMDAQECDALVVVASNYDGFPGPSRRLLERQGFRRDALFFDLASLGCGGVPPGVELANLLVQSGRCETVCLVVAEILGTHIQMRRQFTAPSMGEIVARVLPSDGAAAMIFSRTPGRKPVLSYSSCRLDVSSWKDSDDLMVATTSESGEPLGLIGKAIRTRLLEESAPVLPPPVLKDPMYIHGGGPALLKRLGAAIPELASSAELSMQVLRAHGNMSAPTVLHVLSRALKDELPVSPRVRLLAFGPGVSTSVVCLDGVERTS